MQEDRNQRGVLIKAEIGTMHFEDGGRRLYLLCSNVDPLVCRCNVLQHPVWMDEHS